MEPTYPAGLFAGPLSPTDSSTVVRMDTQVRLAARGRAVVPTNDLNLEQATELGLCRRETLPDPQPILTLNWGGEDYDYLITSYEKAVFRVFWREHVLHVVQASWETSCGSQTRYWLIAETREVAEAFLLEVARRTNAPGESILVFHDGYWQRSHELYLATQSASFDDLVLAGSLKETLRGDFHQFLSARSRYESLGVPWRRGSLLIGPPGNGKTHCVRALVKELGIPCLYVRSLHHQYYTSEHLLQTVFDRARQLRPCILILEDLDSLINAENQSFFLNQLDGFDRNIGLLVIATTNHPEKIDRAIVDRPSRFDRKYHFSLPGVDERQAYLRHWQGRLMEETRWTEESLTALASRTEGFSFAYLKELVIGGLLQWMNSEQRDFALVLDQKVTELAEQMKTNRSHFAESSGTSDVST